MDQTARLTTARPVHPLAWWSWALGLASAVNLTTNPLVLLLLAAAVTAVVLLRRSDAPWARSIRAYFVLAGIVIAVRLFFQVVLGARTGGTVLLDLPSVPLPAWAAGITLGGPITAEALAYTFYDALRLAVMLLCLGAANALANPRQALRNVPAALYEASVAVVIALSVAPQLVESAQRVVRARRLRGSVVKGLRAATTIVVPVLEDAIERSLALAAAMESRGFGRTATSAGRRSSLAVMLASVLAATMGGYLVLAEPGLLVPAVALLTLGAAGLALGLRLAGRRLHVTRYRPQPFTGWDAAVAGCGPAVLVVLAWMSSLPGSPLLPGTDPLTWPALTPAMLLAAGLAVLPLPLTARGARQAVPA